MQPEPLTDDDLGNTTADPSDVAYDAGWHDGCDYGYRLALSDIQTLEALRPCPNCVGQGLSAGSAHCPCGNCGHIVECWVCIEDTSEHAGLVPR